MLLHRHKSRAPEGSVALVLLDAPPSPGMANYPLLWSHHRLAVQDLYAGYLSPNAAALFKAPGEGWAHIMAKLLTTAVDVAARGGAVVAAWGYPGGAFGRGPGLAGLLIGAGIPLVCWGQNEKGGNPDIPARMNLRPRLLPFRV